MTAELEAARMAADTMEKAAREATEAARLARKRLELTVKKVQTAEQLQAIEQELNGLSALPTITIKNLSRDEQGAELLEGLPLESASQLVRIYAYSDGVRSVGDMPLNPYPELALPRLLPDHSDVDAAYREHLDEQVSQIVAAFKRLTAPEHPYLPSRILQKYLEDNYTIPHPDYWKARTNPKEPERWWKNIYDKAIERMDLTLHLISRSDVTGKKGLYALTEYLVGRPPAQRDLFDAEEENFMDQLRKLI